MSNTPQYHDKKRLDKFSSVDRLSSVEGKRTKKLRERLVAIFERDYLQCVSRSVRKVVACS